MILGSNGTGSVVSEPPGIACPPTCSAPFPAVVQVTLIATPDPATPFLKWKFGCTVSPSDPRRCTLTATNHPNWVGVAMGRTKIGVPTTLAVLFDIARVERRITGLELDCGPKCEHRYVFGTRESCARSVGRMALHAVERLRARRACTLYIGPVTTLGALFTENLAPQLQSSSRRRDGRPLAS